jgi:spermidine synthase
LPRGAPYVVDRDGRRALHFTDVAIQSEMDVDAPLDLLYDYTRTMMGFVLFNEAPERIEMIGLGGGSLARYCHATLPATVITVVEISAEVIALRDTFQVPPDDARFRVVCADGADYVRRRAPAPDVLLVDGYDHDGQSPQLCTSGFYDYCHSRLAPGGVLVVNLWGSDPQFGVYTRRLRESFLNNVVVVPTEGGTNKVVFAFKDAAPPADLDSLVAAAVRLQPRHPLTLKPVAQRIAHRAVRLRSTSRRLWCESI